MRKSKIIRNVNQEEFQREVDNLLLDKKNLWLGSTRDGGEYLAFFICEVN